MKLPDHVDNIRTLIESSFNKMLLRLGVSSGKVMEISKLPPELHNKRKKVDELIESHQKETGSYEEAREKILDELTFTLFNRLAILKVMEAHLLFPEIVTKRAEHGGRSFGHRAWLEDNPSMKEEEFDGLREYLKEAFNQLGEEIPLFNKDYPYAFLPHIIELNEIVDAFSLVERDDTIDSDIWKSGDILGWLYESYNNSKKEQFKASKEKAEYDKVHIQSQIYTPRWVVKFLVDNSLGKLYLESYPDSPIKEHYKIANAPQTAVREKKPLTEIKLIDPACGSGNFLIYAFDLFYELYLDQNRNYGTNYQEREIPRLIIENNLHGIDLDDRAIQLAQLGLYLKAKLKGANIEHLHFNIVSSDFFLPDYKELAHIFEDSIDIYPRWRDVVQKSWEDLKEAYKFGSLIKVGEELENEIQALTDKNKRLQGDLFVEHHLQKFKKMELKFFELLESTVEQYAKKEGTTFLTTKTKDAINFFKIITTKYDVAAANPPYTDSSDFGPDLKRFIDENYKKPEKFHINLYAAFIKRCYNFVDDNGKLALIHPLTFMYIKSFEDVRSQILNNTHINVFVDYGLSNLFGIVMVDPAFYVLEKGIKTEEKSWFISLDQYTRTPNEKYKKDFCLQALDDHISKIKNEHNYLIQQNKLKKIKSWPFIYWISDEFREKFKLPAISELVDIKSGLATANNNRFLRYWWEIDKQTISKNYQKDRLKWVRYAKGGTFNKWYGNLWLVVNWRSSGEDMRMTGRAVFRNQHYYFKKGITYSATSTKGTSFRILPENCIYDVKGASAFAENNEDLSYILSLFNSKLSSYIIDCLNNTVETQVGDIQRVPCVYGNVKQTALIKELVNRCLVIKKHLCSFAIIEANFKSSPVLINEGKDFNKSIKSFLNYENHLLTQVLINEALINEKVFEIYELTEADRAMVLAKEGESIGGLPVSPEAKAAYLAEEDTVNEFPLTAIRDYIENLPEKEFAAEEIKEIAEYFPTLYQKNNNLEEFCIRHQINPINVWYWFKEKAVLPVQRGHELALEFLTDLIREILQEDEDGIVPLVVKAGEETLIGRFEQKFYQKGLTPAQLSTLSGLLGRELDDYLVHHFFKELSDHLNLFMYLPKTPFIWHLTSGPEQGFAAYIIIYKWSRDKLFNLKSVYIERRERALENRLIDLGSDESAGAQSEKDIITRQLEEINSFKSKIDELLEEGYNPILDDGVGKNIAPLQKKGMLAYDVLNAGQLKKYLNADW